ncbi:hypothetical protein D3C72_1846530 [compost metagenome]
MQWPPTRPGRNGRKFHLVPAACSTASVSMPILLKIRASSLISAMFTSRCVFSITLAASATRMLDALCVPAVMISLYSWSTSSATSGVEPEVTFLIVLTRCSLSPGLIRSGL